MEFVGSPMENEQEYEKQHIRQIDPAEPSIHTTKGNYYDITTITTQRGI
jgi:hypothetical protein